MCDVLRVLASLLNIIKISYVWKEIQCTQNKSQKISTGLKLTILSMSQNTSETQQKAEQQLKRFRSVLFPYLELFEKFSNRGYKNNRLYRAVTNVFNTATLDIFQMEQPIILGQDLKFFSTFLDGQVEKMVGDVLESWSGYFDYTQKLQNWVAAILDFFLCSGVQESVSRKDKMVKNA